MSESLAIIGAGLSGLTVARALDNRFNIKIFEKSTKPGGRIASRAVSGTTFDHGAQFFTAKSASFQQFITPLLRAGLIADWQARFAEFDAGKMVNARKWDAAFPHYVGVPAMAAIGEALATDLPIEYNCQIVSVFQDDQKWYLVDKTGKISPPFDWLIIALPAEQTRELIPTEVSFYQDMLQINMLPCYALMVSLTQDPEFECDAALVKNRKLSWISVNHTKPGRQGFGIVAHAANHWALENLTKPLPEVKASLLRTLIEITNLSSSIIQETDVKRWVYANSPRQDGSAYFIDDKKHIAACGDWCLIGRIEAAYTSASLLAERLFVVMH
ncbi:putative deoxyribodipyrimidine photolyase [Methylophaga frappieri]|uniref:Putative deoxyribodipyrimidine photolyase n=1 Tax=Methylophaga frappieri (strain ATCC BAA-2434 / DSM 25690 / JAM7) TaxID=754477 RepID=I1YG99_METFJ|nr:NAD(P)-binding protein [Methylophaga frappieri]AFJ01942.1 putative deoxyribodipyrimidine photolyase [Methylophaga frappieri]